MPLHLLDLPPELLELAASNLDWDRNVYLTPLREWRNDLKSLSLTCRQLRQVATPIMYRHVQLDLRLDSSNSSIAQVHRQRIDTISHAMVDSTEYAEIINESPTGFRAHALALSRKLLRDVEGWEDTVPNSLGESTEDWYGLLKPAGFQLPLPTTTATAIATTGVTALNRGTTPARSQWERNKRHRNLRFQLDALTVIFLCLPPTAKSIVFDSAPAHHGGATQNQFATHVLAAAMDIFGSRLQSLTTITSDFDGTDNWKTMLRPDICGKVQALKSLKIDTNGKDRLMIKQATFLEDLHGWHALSDTLTHLALWHIAGEPYRLVGLLKGFVHAKSLYLNGIKLNPDLNARESNLVAWPAFLINVRRQMPTLAIELRNVQDCEGKALTDSAIAWLLKGAVPVGCEISPLREGKLLEDFQDFLLLWTVDDGKRGAQARKEWDESKLVDMALANRWRGQSPEVEFLTDLWDD
ncbi:uncharacterized protein LTR77_000469 [Saxophila tyrrhenica]|uniref:F-box domain-containing protein n=1 Tax=Saxophila tyrrhenica TaxID=1690608 RepID=A0AAV9PMY1_9PEZI|nr:hypothetical protein LTR77_000469 [Saxophila tyrrhenica]